ncbi:hypothetical protein B0H13DRAFT_1876054 [Mycena leptocephala]|nr:hypothetical protein B0H13DRAFT_1876054 [Mycena leptocephala]
MIRGYTAWLGTEQRGGTGERRGRARDKGGEKGRGGKSISEHTDDTLAATGSVGVAMGRRMSQVSKPGKKARDSWIDLDLLVRTQLVQDQLTGDALRRASPIQKRVGDEGAMAEENRWHRWHRDGGGRKRDDKRDTTQRDACINPLSNISPERFLCLGTWLSEGWHHPVFARLFSECARVHFHLCFTMYLACTCVHFHSPVMELKKNADCTILFWSCAELQSHRNSSPYAKLNMAELELCETSVPWRLKSRAQCELKWFKLNPKNVMVGCI